VMWPGHGAGPVTWLWPAAVLLALTAAGLAVWALTSARRKRAAHGGPPARQILRLRLARGQISPADYHQRLAVLQDTAGRGHGRAWRGTIALAAGAAVLAGVAAATGAASGQPAGSGTRPGTDTACTVPPLPGHTVSVTLSDMGTMMDGSGPIIGRNQPGWYSGAKAERRMRMMAITASPATVPAGTVSFRARNAGSMTHELVILPLPTAGAGTRAIGAGGTVSERGSLGEASATCAAGTGEGISAGATGWMTLHLAPGGYELICNRPGHYAAGMYAHLDVR
jgi:uncharacterized cupredoxin-like copper-binding protein